MKKTNDTMKNLLGLNEEFILDLDAQNEDFSLNEDEDEDEGAKGSTKKDDDDEGAKEHKHEPDVRSSELKTDLTELDNKVLNAQTAVDVANVLKLFLTKISKDAAEQIK